MSSRLPLKLRTMTLTLIHLLDLICTWFGEYTTFDGVQSFLVDDTAAQLFIKCHGEAIVMDDMSTTLCTAMTSEPIKITSRQMEQVDAVSFKELAIFLFRYSLLRSHPWHRSALYRSFPSLPFFFLGAQDQMKSAGDVLADGALLLYSILKLDPRFSRPGSSLRWGG